MLEFALFCTDVGIINSPNLLLGQFFENVFVVLKHDFPADIDSSVVDDSHHKSVPADDIIRIHNLMN